MDNKKMTALNEMELENVAGGSFMDFVTDMFKVFRAARDAADRKSEERKAARKNRPSVPVPRTLL